MKELSEVPDGECIGLCNEAINYASVAIKERTKAQVVTGKYGIKIKGNCAYIPVMIGGNQPTYLPDTTLVNVYS